MLLKAYAKINLTLDVLSKRPDGYHNIDSVMQSVSLCDILKVEALREDIKVIFKDTDIDSNNNTAFKAAKEFFEFTDISGGALIEIEKNIPQCAGLGGPSADAAAVIIALDRIFNTKLKTSQLIEIGLKVGADVPFCIVGGTLRVGGIGDKIERISPWQNNSILLAKRSEKKSTGQMYSMLDGLETPALYTDKMVKSINSGDLDGVYANLGNAFAQCYGNADLSVLNSLDAKAVSLSGSGPTYFCVWDGFDLDSISTGDLQDCGFETYKVKTVDCGVEIIAE